MKGCYMSLKWSILLVIAVLLQSCGSSLFVMDDIMMLERGNTRKDVQTMVKLKPRYGKPLNYKENRYIVEYYRMKIGNRRELGEDSKGRASIENTKNIDIYQDYYFLYNQNDQVIFWGTTDDFKAAEDSTIIQIGASIKKNSSKWDSE